MATDSGKDGVRKSFVARLRERNGDARPHFVICGSDALVYTLADELASSGRLRLTVITPPDLRPGVPDLNGLRARGVRVITAARLDERTFREAGLAGAAALALVMPDDMVNLHAALCARAVEGDLRLVIRMFTTGLAYGVRRLFADCAVLSDAAMAAPAFVAAALGEVAPTHFRYAARTLTVAKRGDVPDQSALLTLATFDDAGRMTVLPAEPGEPERQPADLVLAEASGRPAAQAVTARRLARAGRRRRPWLSIGRAARVGLTRKLGIAVLVALALTVISGILLTRLTGVDGFWKSIYITLLTVVGSSDVEPENTAAAQAAQLVLTLAGVALLPLITAAVVDGVVKTRLALNRGEVLKVHSGHIVLVGLGTVGTRVLRQLIDLGLDVVAIDRDPKARGVKVAESLGVPVVTGDAAQEETLRAASIHHCQSLVVVSTNDAVNLQAALHARAAREDIRVVLRLFDDDFAQRVEAAFNINISRSVSRLCAPAFAAAMREREVLATIPVERHALLVAAVRVMPGSALDGAPLDSAERPESTRVIGMTAAGSEWVDWLPDGRRVLAAGDEIVVVARRAGLRALSEEAASHLSDSAAGE
ncbi:potassium channel family protein [Paractinoplanes lichenicola]|uniref:TrkA family potassium uptake protein n=1 Tax=Paractinoplanes lichenicola TaxID=2802976 RepID=A0ABS1VIK8_9ACTN|nr:TrkA family potassium uptake protein [Actinoplanes lichenicola]MBL7254542.1 TrkA family potassium uptake protein [Actinoplanes lichenicola]